MKVRLAWLVTSALVLAACAAQKNPTPPPSPKPARPPGEVRYEAIKKMSRKEMASGQALAQVADAEMYLAAPSAELDTETYDFLVENGFHAALTNPLSTFSIDVDTASYSNVRRFLREGRMPPPGAVRIEELVNYFGYRYPEPRGNDPFGVGVEVNEAPWKPEHRLVRIGIKGKEIAAAERPASNLVFLLDVSGSMNDANKLGLLKSAMRMLVDNLNSRDRVTIVVYAGAAGLVLPPTYADDGQTILAALGELEAGGSTAGGAGIRLAYEKARESFVEGGINRVILATDGDFNVGVTNQSELVTMIRKEAESGVFLTVLGFGMGNYKDSTLEKLADQGNGNYAYIDTKHEARKVLVEQIGSTLLTIAKDVKIQVEFNPALVSAYRLIGYENRMLRSEDFNDDTKDAGEIGAGHTVTALYEVVPVGREIDLPGVDPLKYRRPAGTAEEASAELLTVKVRYKDPDGDESRLLSYPVIDDGAGAGAASDDFLFAAAVASFGMILRESEHCGDMDLERVAELARSGAVVDDRGYRSEFVELVEVALITDG